MFWLFKKIFWLGVLVGLVYYGAQYKIDGRPVKDYAQEFYESPLVQAVIKTGKEMLSELINDKLKPHATPQANQTQTQPPPSKQSETQEDHLTEQDQEALQKLLDKQ